MPRANSMQAHRTTSRVWLNVLLLIDLAIRIGWAMLLPANDASLARLPDQVGYLELGRNVLHGQGLVWTDPRFDDRTYAVRMPGYPLFVAACGGNVRAIRIVQAIIDTSTVLAIYLLARRWLSGGASLLAAALAAFNPFLVYLSALVLSETLFTAMLAWGMVLLTADIRLVWGGLLLSISVMVRPEAGLLPVILGFTAVLLPTAKKVSGTFFRFRLPVGSMMLLLVGLMLIPWAIRNRLVLGRWVFTTTNGGFVLYDGFNPDADGSSNQSALTSPEWRIRLRNLSEIERERVLRESASRYINQTWNEQPQWLCKLTAMKVLRTWSPVPLSSEFGSRKSYIAVALLFSIPFDLLIVLGLWTGRLPRSAKFYLLLPAIYLTVVHALSVGSLRYRVPAEPILAVLAAAGMANAVWWKKKGIKQDRSLTTG